MRYNCDDESHRDNADFEALVEIMDHHPNWDNVYNQVTIRLSTHDAGGLTEKDFQLARAIDSVLP